MPPDELSRYFNELWSIANSLRIGKPVHVRSTKTIISMKDYLRLLTEARNLTPASNRSGRGFIFGMTKRYYSLMNNGHLELGSISLKQYELLRKLAQLD